MFAARWFRGLYPPLILALFLLTLLIFAPQAAGQTQAPPVPEGSVASAIRETNQVLAEQGAANTTLVFVAIGAVVFSIAVVVLVGVIAWKFGLPLVNSNVQANQRADEASQALLSRIRTEDADRRAAEGVRLQMLQVLERIATMQSQLPPELEQIKGAITDAAESTASTVTGHVDTKVGELDGKLSQAITALEELKRETVTAEHFNRTVTTQNKKLDEAIRLLHELKKGDAEPIPPHPPLTDGKDAHPPAPDAPPQS